MRITREKVEQLMQHQWDKGYEAGVTDGVQRQLVEAQATALSRTKSIDLIENTLDTIEGKKSPAG